LVALKRAEQTLPADQKERDQRSRSLVIPEEIMPVHGIRGAITVENDQSEAVLTATRELLEAILQANPGLEQEAIASIFFTTTDDLVSVHPALAARQMGWTSVPMMCALEIPVPGCLPRCVRVLIHWNSEVKQEAVKHVYLREAVQLRPDLSAG
jgi:chorismate mutase